MMPSMGVYGGYCSCYDSSLFRKGSNVGHVHLRKIYGQGEGGRGDGGEGGGGGGDGGEGGGGGEDVERGGWRGRVVGDWEVGGEGEGELVGRVEGS